MPKNRTINRPIIMGIVGDSAAGKTTLTRGVSKILGRQNVATFCMDDYHRYDRVERKQNGMSPLDPECNFLDILERDLAALREHKPILKPIYNHNSGCLERPEYLEPKPYVIAEGLFGFHTRAMRDSFDVKIYLKPQESLRVEWKVERDTKKRGYVSEEVNEELKKRSFYSKKFIDVQATYADIVVEFFQSNNTHLQTLDVCHTMRPTLPHPDLSRVLDADTANDMILKLARDQNGKPVDKLFIHGKVSEENAAKLEALLWDDMGEVEHLKIATKEFMGEAFINHPLLLTQLLLSYHMVKAAQGITAL